MANANAIGALLRQARQEAHIGLRELARSVEVSPGYLCDVEHGRKSPHFDLLRKLGKWVRIEPQWLDDPVIAASWLSATPRAVAVLRAMREAQLSETALDGLQRHVESLGNRCAAANERCRGG